MTYSSSDLFPEQFTDAVRFIPHPLEAKGELVFLCPYCHRWMVEADTCPRCGAPIETKG